MKLLKLKNLLISKLNVKDENLNNMFDRALEITQDSVEIYSLTKEIRDNFSHNEILEILEYMWVVMLADGHVDDFEAAMMTKLIGLSVLNGKRFRTCKENAQKIINTQNQ